MNGVVRVHLITAVVLSGLVRRIVRIPDISPLVAAATLSSHFIPLASRMKIS